jgi:hypothetical protein
VFKNVGHITTPMWDKYTNIYFTKRLYMKLYEIATNKIDPRLQQVAWNTPEKEALELLHQCGYTDANIMYILTKVSVIAVVRHLKANNAPISEVVTLFIIKNIPSARRVIRELPITDAILFKLASLKGTNFEELVSLLPNISDDVLIAAIHKKPNRAKAIRHLVRNISSKLAEVIQSYGFKVDEYKTNTNLDEDLNKWSEKQLLMYFKKLPMDHIKFHFRKLTNPSNKLIKVVIQRNGSMIRYVSKDRQTPDIQLLAVKQQPNSATISGIIEPTLEVQEYCINTMAFLIKSINNPDRSIIIKAFTINPTLLPSMYESHLLNPPIFSNLFKPDIIKEVLTSQKTYTENNYITAIIKFIKIYFKDNTLLMNKWIRYAEQQSAKG